MPKIFANIIRNHAESGFFSTVWLLIFGRCYRIE
jgi:hypothetical protein